MVYDRVYTPARKYCRRAPPHDILTKIVSKVKTLGGGIDRYMENSGKLRLIWPPFFINFKVGSRRGIEGGRFLSGQSGRDKTVPADRSIYGPGRRREGRGWEGEAGDGGYNMGYRGGPTPGGEQGPSFYYPGSHRGSQPSSLRVLCSSSRVSSTSFLLYLLLASSSLLLSALASSLSYSADR